MLALQLRNVVPEFLRACASVLCPFYRSFCPLLYFLQRRPRFLQVILCLLQRLVLGSSVRFDARDLGAKVPIPFGSCPKLFDTSALRIQRIQLCACCIELLLLLCLSSAMCFPLRHERRQRGFTLLNLRLYLSELGLQRVFLSASAFYSKTEISDCTFELGSSANKVSELGLGALASEGGRGNICAYAGHGLFKILRMGLHTSKLRCVL